MIFTPCFTECSDEKNIYTEKTFFNKTEKRSVPIFTGLSCKSTKNLYCAKCYKCNKNDFFEEKKGDFKEQCFFFPLSSFSLYCNDLPNALDTAVRLCSYSLTLAVLNGSARMKYSSKEDRAFIFKTLNTSGNMVSTYKEVNLTDYGRYVNKSQCRVKIVNADKCSTVAVVYF